MIQLNLIKDAVGNFYDRPFCFDVPRGVGVNGKVLKNSLSLKVE